MAASSESENADRQAVVAAVRAGAPKIPDLVANGHHGNGLPTIAGPAGLLSRLFEDPEDRKHRQVVKTELHVGEEVDLAVTVVTHIAENAHAAMLDSEAQFEVTNEEYASRSTYAAEAAPFYTQLCRSLMVDGVRAIITGGRDRAVREIDKR